MTLIHIIGTVSNTSSSKAPIYNNGTITINGGTFTTGGGIASLIDNGWYTPSENTAKYMATLIINDGTFEMNNDDKYIKNDDYGIMTINGGTFNMNKPSSAAVANVGFYTGDEILTVNGGTFNYSGTNYAIWDYDWTVYGYSDNSTTIISGGTYNLGEAKGISNVTFTTTDDDKVNSYKVVDSDEIIIAKESELTEKTITDVITEEEVKEDADKVNAAVKEISDSATVAAYYDINLYKAYKDTLVGDNIPEPGKAFTITVDIPTSLVDVKEGFFRKYFIIRVHDGVAERLDVKDNGDGTISFDTDKFSTYALVYEDLVKTVAKEDIPALTISSENDVEVPQTYDNGVVSIVIGMLSLICLSVTLFNLKKENN